MKKLVLGIILVCAFTGVNAQIGGGLKAGYDFYVGGTKPIRTISIAGFMDWQKEDDYGFRFGVGYGLPNKQTDTYSARAYASYTNPQNVNVTGDFKVSFVHVTVDFKKYFGRAGYDDGGFYVAAGLGYSLAMAQTTYDYGKYSRNDYTVTGVSGEEDRVFLGQYMLRGFCGYELDVNVGKVFGELGLSFPANTVDGTVIPVNLPPYLQFGLGFRF